MTSTNRLGAASFIVAGVLYIVNFGFLLVIGEPPSAGENLLRLVNQQKLLGQTIFIVFFIIDILLISSILALLVALRKSDNGFSLIGGVLAVASLTIDLVNTILAYAIIGLSQAYSTSTIEARRVAYAVSAEVLSQITFDVGTRFFMILFSISTLILASAMLKQNFGRSAGYLGVVAGLAGIAAGLSGFIFASIPWAVWFLAVGYRLWKLD